MGMVRRLLPGHLLWPWAIALAVAFAFLSPDGGPPPALGRDLCVDTGSSEGPFDMLAYEVEDWRTVYGGVLELAALNQLLPDFKGFAVPALERGPRSSGSDEPGEPYIPPTLLKAIAWIESAWMQADWSVPYGAVGPVLLSHACAYGIMQIVSGMQNTTGVPTLEQAMIGGHYTFNIARGAYILGVKWNLAPEYRPLVGQRDPYTIEDWYYAVWSYHGFAFQNHPLNPSYPWPRVPYSCGPADDGFGHDRTNYPYQELVFGCMERPPVIDGEPLWAPQEAHLPDLSDPAVASALDLANWTPCVVEFDCAPMDLPTPNPSHQDTTMPSLPPEEALATPAIAVAPQEVALEAHSGSPGQPVEIAVSNPGTGVLVWRATASEPWLQLSRVQGVALGAELLLDADTPLSVWADASGLEMGTYTATLILDSLYAEGAPVEVVVTLEVLEPLPTPTPTPTPDPGDTPTPGPTPTPTATPSPTPTPTPLPPPFGDADCDGEVTSVDALLILRRVAGLDRSGECTPVSGDVDCDGDVDAVDALKVLRYVAGLESTLPVGCFQRR